VFLVQPVRKDNLLKQNVRIAETRNIQYPVQLVITALPGMFVKVKLNFHSFAIWDNT
jgi:hypothetical protein